MFREMDVNRDNRIQKSEFRKALKKLNIDLLPDDIDKLFERFDLNRDGSLQYREFLELLDARMNSEKSVDRYDKNSSGNNNISGILSIIRKKLDDYLGPGANSAKRLREVRRLGLTIL